MLVNPPTRAQYCTHLLWTRARTRNTSDRLSAARARIERITPTGDMFACAHDSYALCSVQHIVNQNDARFISNNTPALAGGIRRMRFIRMCRARIYTRHGAQNLHTHTTISQFINVMLYFSDDPRAGRQIAHIARNHRRSGAHRRDTVVVVGGGGIVGRAAAVAGRTASIGAATRARTQR